MATSKTSWRGPRLDDSFNYYKTKLEYSSKYGPDENNQSELSYDDLYSGIKNYYTKGKTGFNDGRNDAVMDFLAYGLIGDGDNSVAAWKYYNDAYKNGSYSFDPTNKNGYAATDTVYNDKGNATGGRESLYGWDGNHVLEQVTLPLLTTQQPTWNPSKYNVSIQNIRDLGDVNNIFSLYASAMNSGNWGNGYIAYLHDRYGNDWSKITDPNKFRSAVISTLDKSEGLRGGVRGHDATLGYNNFRAWIDKNNVTNALKLNQSSSSTILNTLNNTTLSTSNWLLNYILLNFTFNTKPNLTSTLIGKYGITPYRNMLYDYTGNVPLLSRLSWFLKNGGTLNTNKMNYYQEGGAVAPLDGGQQDPQQQIIALLQAAQQGDQLAIQTLLQIQQAAQQGDLQAILIMQMIQQLTQGSDLQAQMARHGAKLNYLNSLKGACPQGSHMSYFKVGGKVCKKCVQDKVKKDCGGAKVKKNCSGGVSKLMGGIRAEMGAKLAHGGHVQSTAFGDCDYRPSRVHAGQGKPKYNPKGTTAQKKVTTNRFTAFGDEGRKKPTNVGLVGHKPKYGGRTAAQSSANNKHTAFGGAVARSHRGAKASTVGGIKKTGGPQGLHATSGITKVSRHAFGGNIKKRVKKAEAGTEVTKSKKKSNNAVVKQEPYKGQKLSNILLRTGNKGLFLTTYKDRASRDSDAVNRYGDTTISGSMPGRMIGGIWTPDRTSRVYRTK